MSHELADKLDRLPPLPGVYLFKNQAGEVIYVGKAKSLRARVRSYFNQPGDERLVVRFIDLHVRDLEVIQTRNEKEAFLLENNLIKKLKPRYNIRLRDDKTFLHVMVDRNHPFPAIVPMRRPRKRTGVEYYGPYASASAIRNTLRMIRGFLPLRDCSDHEFANRSRPCIKHQIKMCSAPCVGMIDAADYRALLDETIEILKGKTDQLVERLQLEMARCSANLEFERAAVLRDQVAFLRSSTSGQKVEAAQRFNLDVVGMHRQGGLVEVVVLFFRDGKLVATSPFCFESDLPPGELVSEFLWQFYLGGQRAIPEEILVPCEVYGRDVIEEALCERAETRVTLRDPERGEKVKLLGMANENARLSLKISTDSMELNARLLESIKDRLELPRLPASIECYDISDTFGSGAVGSLVRFENGEPYRTGYRRFRIRKVAGANDYAMLGEVLRRRLDRGVRERDLPDLLFIDGGKGQLHVAEQALAEVRGRVPGVSLPMVASIAKGARRGRGVYARAGEEDRVFSPYLDQPVPLAPDSPEAHLLQRIRDEAHRFAIQYHRKVRARRSLRSGLDGIAGLGPKKRARVIAHFGGSKQLTAASVEELEQVPGLGRKLALQIYQALHG